MDSYFYRASLKKTYHSTEPDIPKGNSFSWVFYAAELAILEIPSHVARSGRAQRIEGNLEALLASGRGYAPALALVFEELEGSALGGQILAARMEQLLTDYWGAKPLLALVCCAACKTRETAWRYAAKAALVTITGF